MRQRLAEALGKNRSFITQISNPGYQTPIPVQHLPASSRSATSPLRSGSNSCTPTIKRIRAAWLMLQEREKSRRVTIMLPDLGSDRKNRRLDALVSEFADKIAGLLEEP